MATSPTLTFPSRLLAKALIQRARTASAATCLADAEKQFTRNSYIIQVLEGPVGLRDTVKVMAAASSSTGQKQLLAILTMFEILSPDDKEDYIVAFKGCATLATQGSREVFREHAWDPLQIPPRQEP